MTAERLAAAIDHLRENRPSEAAVLLRAVIRDDPDQPDALHLIGLWHHERGEHADAEASIRHAIERWPSGDHQVALAWNNLGNVLVEQRRTAEALDAYRCAIDANPGAAPAWSNRANLLRRLGRLDEALSAALVASDLASEQPDAWSTLARIQIECGDVAAGVVSQARAVALAPRSTVGRDQVVRALVALGRYEEAAAMYREWLAQHPDDPVARHHLAAISGGTPPERAADDYVATVFDEFAATFDAKLAELGYRAPALVREALGDVPQLGDVADLGCGTGLLGPLLRARCRTLTGVDLSVGMLRAAQRRDVYDHLFHIELVEFLRNEPGQFETIVSADTLCYLGALEAFAAAAAVALRPGGNLVYTVEALADDDPRDWAITPSGRFAHTERYLRRTLGSFGTVAVSEETLRAEAGRPVRGFVVRATR